MRRLSVVLVSALIGATLAMPAAAQWKWRGKGGQIQYSDTPPPAGTADQDILQRPNPNRRLSPIAASAAASGASVVSARATEPELEAKRKKVEQENAEKDKAEQAKLVAAKADSCARAKGYLRTLDDGVRIARTDAKGEREILDDKARAEETRRTREIIAADCK